MRLVHSLALAIAFTLGIAIGINLLSIQIMRLEIEKLNLEKLVLIEELHRKNQILQNQTQYPPSWPILPKYFHNDPRIFQ